MMRWLILFAVLLAPARAGAEIVAVLDGRINFTPPDRFCLLHPENEKIDAAIFKKEAAMLRRTNRLLAVTYDCRYLARLHQGSREEPDEWGLFMAPLTKAKLDQPAGSQRIDVVKSVLPDTKQLKQSELDSRVSSAVSHLGIRSNRSEYIGVLSQDENAAYLGFLVRFSHKGQDHVVAGVAAMTFIQGAIVEFCRYRPFASKDTIALLLSEQKDFVRELIDLNVPASQRTAELTQPAPKPAVPVSTGAAGVPNRNETAPVATNRGSGWTERMGFAAAGVLVGALGMVLLLAWRRRRLGLPQE